MSKEKGAAMLAEALFGKSKSAQQFILSKLGSRQRKAVEKKLHLLEKKKRIKEEVERHYLTREHYDAAHPDYKRLSAEHKKIHQEILQKKSSKKDYADYLQIWMRTIGMK